MSWVQQQIASLLNLNINRLMISLYSRNLDPFILSLYCPRRIYSKLPAVSETSKNISFCVCVLYKT